MAWYPVCRIPDAPLAARFLAFYRLAPQPAGPRHGTLPLHALWWHNVVAGTPHGLPREQWMAADGGDVPPDAKAVEGAVRGAPVTTLPSPYGEPDEWPAVVQRLQDSVAALARGVGVVGADDGAPLPTPFYADYDFFASRRDLNAL